MREKIKVLVSGGYLVRCPLAGYAWQYLHYLLGLRNLGFDPYFYEDSTLDWNFCENGFDEYFNPETNTIGNDPKAGINFIRNLFEKYDLHDRWVFNDTVKGKMYGLTSTEFNKILGDTNILINLGGVSKPPFRKDQCRIFIDIDPGVTQIQVEKGHKELKKLLSDYNFHFTFGERISNSDCKLPSGGFKWYPTRQPIALELWKSKFHIGDDFTTIGVWDDKERDVTFNDETYLWRKRTEWLKFINLPKITAARFNLATDVHKVPEDLELLNSYGWKITNPLAISSNPFVYKKFIQGSKGEFSVAKDLNIRLKSGWFSDRSACYLAAGKPVVLQDTGFSKVLPTGKGLFSFTNMQEAVNAINEINKNYEYHCKEARRIAEEYFDSDKVLGKMLKECGI